MSASFNVSHVVKWRLPGAACAVAAAVCLVSCVVAPPPPPPRVVYVRPPPPPPPPPPQVTEAPVDDGSVQVAEAPPPLPDYEQPPIPAEGYLWTPGYWAYSNGYYWVPGTWVQPPTVGVLWTPGYWGYCGGFYTFRPGYWGPHVGFYGGVNYGFGYGGVGFAGGRWVGNSFAYNRAVTNVNVTVVHNTYNETVIHNNTTRTSFNGGAGIRAVPTPAERAVAQESHVSPTPMQRQHVNAAARDPALFARANGGHPAIAATPRPAAFNAPGVVGAHGATPPPHAGPQQHNNIYTGNAPGSAQPKAAVRTPSGNAVPRAQGAPPKANGAPPPKPKAPPARPQREPESNNKP